MTTKRKTALIHGRRVYVDSIAIKELSPDGAVILYGDGVNSYADDWDRTEVAKPVTLRFARTK